MFLKCFKAEVRLLPSSHNKKNVYEVLSHKRNKILIKYVLFSLISIAKVCGQNSFIRPKLNVDGIIEIKGGRHPLMEQIIPQYQTNHFSSGGQNSRIKIVTGKNEL